MRRRKNTRQAPRPVSVTPYYVLLVVVVLFFGLIRFRLRDIPLERDEGEYAYAGQLLLQGIPPYTLAYNMKLPGTYAAYAVIMTIFGQTPAGIHVGLLMVNAATTVLVFFLVRRVFDSTAGAVAATSYALLSTSPWVVGFAAHATHFVVLAAISGTLVLLNAIRSRRALTLFLSGVLFGMAFLMKQPGICFVAFAVVCLVKSHWQQKVGWRDLGRRLTLFCCGVGLPCALTYMWLWRAGVLYRFWFWTFTYARHYATMVSFRDAANLFLNESSNVIGPAVPIWCIAAIGLIEISLTRKSSGPLFLPAAFIVCSFLAVCPGLYFRAHYFILMLPAVSLFAGAAISTTTKKFRDRRNLRPYRLLPTLVFLIAVGYVISRQWAFLFEMDPIVACRWRYSPNPFPEAMPIGDYLKAHTSPSESIAVIGSEPEIYFYSQRRSATGYIYTYALMEEQPYALTMQKEMVSEIEQARPKYLVFVNVSLSWLRRPESPQFLFDWVQKYVADGYEPAGIIDIFENDTQYKWGEDAKGYRLISPDNVQIFKRTSS